MSGLLEELVSVLNEQAENFENLLALSMEKKDVIVKNDVDTLQKITSLENRIVADYGRLEKKRLLLTKDIALVLNKDENELTLSALLGIAENQPEHPSLLAVSERVRRAVSELKRVNEQNKVLIDNSLEYIEFTLNVFKSSMSDGTHYAAKDGSEGRGGNVFFDAKQ